MNLSKLQLLLRDSKTQQQFLRFSATGLITAAIYLATGAALVEWFDLPAALAGFYAFLIIIPINYALHKLWSFESRHLHREAIPRFLTVVTMGIGINSAVIQIIVFYDFHYLLAQIVAMNIVIFWNYIMFAKWVFRS